MTHPNLERLQLYVDERLAQVEALEVERHMASCRRCEEQIRNLRQLVRGLATMNDLTLPPSFARDVAEEVAPSPRFAVEPPRTRLFIQATICLIILLTSGALLLIVDTPVTDPSDGVLGAVDLLLGSPFQEQATTVAVLAIMAIAGLGVIACLIAGMPAIRPRRHVHVRSHHPRDHRR
jgi:anti-sigma factor RsiW